MIEFVRKTLLGIRYFKNIIFRFVANCFPVGSDYLVFCERGDTAHDNAFFLFKYYREKHPEVKCVYILSKDAACYSEVRKIGRVIKWRSFSNYLYYYSAKVILSTHIGGGCCDWDVQFRFGSKLRPRGKTVFLQHGITKNDISGLYKENTNVDLFICGAKPEYDYVKERFHYGFNEVLYTGFARFDNLFDYKTQRQILIMPTWRTYLNACSDEDFLKSQFFIHWNNLINDRAFLSLLDSLDIYVVFYLHYSFQNRNHLFVAPSKRVRIAYQSCYDVQTLLKQSILLITDYSSVYFDFAYMDKPMIYYQFDREEYYEKHYSKGYYDEYSMGFGPVIIKHYDLIDYIKRLSENNFCNYEIYNKRSSEFFLIRDRLNCDRIFKAVEKLK